MAESAEAAWLKRSYTEATDSGPAAKRVKFSEIHEGLSSSFPTVLYNSRIVSERIKEAFPFSYTKKVGQARQTYVFGIKPVVFQAATTGSSSACERSPIIEQLTEDNQQLQQRVKELEEKLAQFEARHTHLDEQIGELTAGNSLLHHGPDSIKNFEEFEILDMVAEMKTKAPDVYALFSSLARVDRHMSDSEDEPRVADDLIVLTSVSTLLKSRSQRVHGLQLLMTFMLIARATSKQVRSNTTS